ncbi:hypothetical protein SCOCK_150186 [Actinacidiphila cocklensis]|uniref:Uncharacterized protein n=1 Tax=Actinacidiphila cocklensis TaxID=887465 RepID=A0A9W4DL71_9ACTN|nr:hypothetical protein SCOCK_150186 [Actinacidiphila cocklensis]
MLLKNANGVPPSTGATPVIDRLVDAGAPVDRCCRILGVARQNHYKHKRTPTTPRQLRREWLTVAELVPARPPPSVQADPTGLGTC